MSVSYDVRREDLEKLFFSDSNASKGRQVLHETKQRGPDALSHLLRFHGDESITDQDEIRMRDQVDMLLDYYGILEVGVISGYLEPEFPVSWKTEAMNDLEDPAVRTYYETYYVQPLPVCFRRRLQGEKLYEVATSEKSQSQYLRFLTLHSTFIESEEMRLFARLLDDFYFTGAGGIQELIKVVSNPAELIPILTKPRQEKNRFELAAAGFREYLEFCIACDSILQEAGEFPMLQAAMWQHYSYWFGRTDTKIGTKLDSAIDSLLNWTAGPYVANLDPTTQAQATRELEVFVGKTRDVVHRLISGEYGREFERWSNEHN